MRSAIRSKVEISGSASSGEPDLVPDRRTEDEVDFTEFVERFEPEVSVGLAWSVLRAVGPEVTCRTVGSPSELGEVGLPWYVDASGRRECSYRNPGARRLTIADAARLLDGPLRHRRMKIDEMAADSVDGQTTTLPSYLGDARRELLLDGCHRALSRFVLNRPFGLEICSARGPADPRLLPDLAVAD